MDRDQTLDYWYLLDALIYTQRQQIETELTLDYSALVSECSAEAA